MKFWLRNIIILVVLLAIILMFLFFYDLFRTKEYSKNLFYMDTHIYVKFYTNNSKLAKNALKEVDKLYKEYHELTDRYNEYPGITNLYTINNNVLKDEYLKIDKRLYNIIEYGVSLYEKSNRKVDISMGNVIDIWRGYRSSGLGVPTLEELKYVNYGDINNVILKDNNLIKNNNLNLDLGVIAKGYTTQVVGDYLDSIGIKCYLINAGGNVLLGEAYKKESYKVGLENPNNSADVYKIIKAENKAIVTSGGYERFYDYEGIRYHHIIDPDTLYPTNYMKSVTIITTDSAYADFLSTYLFLLPVDEGKKIVNELDDVEAIWYLNDDTYITSDGFDKYE